MPAGNTQASSRAASLTENANASLASGQFEITAALDLLFQGF